MIFGVWRRLGAILAALGGSWRHLGASWSHLGRSGSHLRGSWAASGRLLEAKLEDLGAILDGLGGQVGGLEANLGASWRQLGRFRCQLGGLGGDFTRFCEFCNNLKKNIGFYCFFEHRRVKLEALRCQVGLKLAVLRPLGSILKALEGS